LPPRTCWQIIAAAGYATSEKAVAYDNRANVRAGANAEALTDFNQDINLRPDEATSYAGRARVRLGVAGIRQSQRRWALPLVPDTVSFHICLGHVLSV